MVQYYIYLNFGFKGVVALEIKIAPSILSCDFSHMGEEFGRMEDAGADWLHIDVMDGLFVPNLTLGAPVIKCLRPSSKLPFDVHLMIENPIRYIGDFARAGADIISFHLEAKSDPRETIDAIHAAGCRAAVAIKPNTCARAVLPLLDVVDMILVMTVEPGFGGQKFMADMMHKITRLRKACDETGREIDIQVDGGITPETIAVAAQAGANVFVAGSAVFSAPDAAEMVRQLRTAASDA